MKHLITVLACITATAAWSQPSGATPGKCYANCYIADQYYTETEQVMLKPPLTRKVLSRPVLVDDVLDMEVYPSMRRFVIQQAVFDTIEEQILIKPATIQYKVIPPVFEKADEPLENPPVPKRYVCVPAVYETQKETVMVSPEYKEYSVVEGEVQSAQRFYDKEPAYVRLEFKEPEYKETTERIEIKPASQKWIKKKGEAGCLQADPDDCFVWCLVEEPAEYQMVTKRIDLGCDGSGIPGSGCISQVQIDPKPASIKVKELVRQAEIQEHTKEARYQTIYKKILRDSAYVLVEDIPEGPAPVRNLRMVKPAEYVEEEVPAEYRTVKRLVLRQQASYTEEMMPPKTKQVRIKKLEGPQTETEELVPGEFITVAKRVMVRQGGFTEWREVLCDEKITGYTIRELCDALRARGYEPGVASNQMDGKTKEALKKFQMDNGLPVGNLDFETLDALGIRY